MELLHGTACPAEQAAGRPDWGQAPYSQFDYDRFKRWGLNAVQFDIWWSASVEKSELDVGVYDEAFLTRLRAQVDLAKQNGLKTQISNHVFFHAEAAWWAGWTDRYAFNVGASTTASGHQYVNMNGTDAAGTRGRERYCAYLSMLASRFPDCMIDPWGFPYHGDGDTFYGNATIHETFYNVTQPAFIQAIRSAGNNQPITLNPLGQGSLQVRPSPNTGVWAVWQTAEFTSPYFKTQSDPLIYYGTGSHDAYRMFAAEEYNVLDSGAAWDYDLDTLYKQWQPAIDFAKTHPVLTVELCALETPADGVTDPSRFAWVEETLKILKANNIDWFWWRYTNPWESQDPYKLDGTDNGVGALLTEYAPIGGPATFNFSVPYTTGTVNLELTKL